MYQDRQMEKWLNKEESTYSARHAVDQVHIRNWLTDKIRSSNEEDLYDLCEKLIARRSNFIVLVLLNDSKITSLFHKRKALKALLKRKKDALPDCLCNVKITIDYLHLSEFGHTDVRRLIKMFINHDPIDWQFVPNEIDKLLIGVAMYHSDDAQKFRKRLNHIIDRGSRSELLNLYLIHI